MTKSMQVHCVPHTSYVQISHSTSHITPIIHTSHPARHTSSSITHPLRQLPPHITPIHCMYSFVLRRLLSSSFLFVPLRSSSFLCCLMLCSCFFFILHFSSFFFVRRLSCYLLFNRITPYTQIDQHITTHT